jgi:hypothetical protein
VAAFFAGPETAAFFYLVRFVDLGTGTLHLIKILPRYVDPSPAYGGRCQMEIFRATPAVLSAAAAWSRSPPLVAFSLNKTAANIINTTN